MLHRFDQRKREGMQVNAVRSPQLGAVQRGLAQF
jgi:hypothetical protein